ncbi:cell surface glycoprotein CD200 receptor 1-A isoform X2 [Anabas testudineus]|uniref:Ig-like domain-containing protein n=1 Tax=Anabas testudineus TaxID=64144 RepID=A0A3Q1I6B0_ANATE|nr:cell surface glycoprotein CD200 receptor 1-A isoform X2 [Anabas testudineus]
MDMMWIYAAIILWVSGTCSMETVTINFTYNLESEVNLTCGNKTWNEMMFVIWKIHSNNKDCKIAFSNDGQSQNNCSGDKSLQNTSDSHSYLYIPKLSADDVGIYKCESVYSGGNENYVINLSFTVSPTVTGWLEHTDNTTIAVCRADRGKPAASISWSRKGSEVVTTQASDGFFTVESRLTLPEGTDTKNLSCIIKHQTWKDDVILELKPSYFPWLWIPGVAVGFVFLVGFFIFAQKKLVMLRQCQQPNNSTSKSSSTEDVEEVQPYASYVQRENSLYNSSADFFSHKSSAHASHAHT